MERPDKDRRDLDAGDAGQGRLKSDHERLWTPWRMPYIGGGAAEPGCLFCNRLASDDDVRSLIVCRTDLAFAIMNLFPYNTGHLMIVPNHHVASPEEADAATVGAMASLLPPALRALRRVLNADGFNVGVNVGAVAGAGVADHLHQHVVPRWQGDANFMPILAATMVLPELIPVTYAKIRAELGRELAGRGAEAADVDLVVTSDDGSLVLLASGDDPARLPVATAAAGESLWKAALRTCRDFGVEASIAGWAGEARFASMERPALTLVASSIDLADRQLMMATIERALSRLQSETDRETVQRALVKLRNGDRK
jgi:ATP adenylyltransferase